MRHFEAKLCPYDSSSNRWLVSFSIGNSPVVRRLVSWLLSIPFLGRLINRIATNSIARSTKPRPRPYSLWWPAGGLAAQGQVNGPITDYASWPSLTDRRFSARHLSPAPEAFIRQLPADAPYDRATGTSGAITALFARPRDSAGKSVMTPDRSSVLFMFFAQWFTDSVLRIDPKDRRRNTSNHDVDLCQIYGLNEQECRCLRSGERGHLRSQYIDGKEFPDSLGERDDQGQWHVKSIYQCDTDSEGNPIPGRGLYPHGSTEWMRQALKGSFGGSLSEAEVEHRLNKLYATGLERGNSSVGYVALSLVFLREHNRICDELSRLHPSWEDERLFQTARMINTCLLLKLTVEEYINHIAGQQVFRLDTTFAEQQDWYRTNWIALEFDLLYRWHGLVPDSLVVNGETVSANEYRWNNSLLEKVGIAGLINAASVQAAGRISLLNNPVFLMESEYRTIQMGRDFRLRSFNDYREAFGLARLTSFMELTRDAELAGRLESLYGSIENLELVVGLFAEAPPEGGLFGNLMRTMVAYDAFTQIYTNPLLARSIHTSEHLTDYGMKLIEGTNSITQLVSRNVGSEGAVSAALGLSQA
jgi:prostaglandin-endoperoxide synthase 2